MSRTLLINVADEEERRAALLEDGRLSLLWVERADEHSLVGNVYLGRILRVEPAIGAAFVDLGLERPAFLHVTDVRRPWAEGDADAEPEPSIEELLRRGENVVVQVSRDPIGTKGATLTSYVSLPGRTLVLMPRLGRVAVSRRIEDPETRERLRETLGALPCPEGVGIVARTASAHAAASELEADLAELVRDYEALAARVETATPPALLHRAADFARRAVCELLVRAPEGAAGPVRVVADSGAALDAAVAALNGNRETAEVLLHEGPLPIFHAYEIEEEVRRLASTRVPLEGGASLVIQETEALWAIDVNSGKRRRGANLEETALQTDLIAAQEVARQIRLRDLAGLIVVDFIDCRDEANRDRVAAAVRAALAKDPARMRVAAMSEFMVLEITRRRSRAGAGRSGSHRCPTCHGLGRVRTCPAAVLAALRDLRAALAAGGAGRIEILCAPAVADALERREGTLSALEQAHDVEIDVVEEPTFAQDGFAIQVVR